MVKGGSGLERNNEIMNILFAAPENAWGGFLELVRKKLPSHHFTATGEFAIQSLAGIDVLIPTMCPITRETLLDANRLKLIQQCGSGLEGVDIAAATKKGIGMPWNGRFQAAPSPVPAWMSSGKSRRIPMTRFSI